MQIKTTLAPALLGAALALGSIAPVAAQTGKQDQPSHTRTFSLNGKTHEFIFPAGYCPLADRGPERDLFNLFYDGMKGNGTVLLYVVIECQEKKEFFSDKREFLDRYIQIQQITPKGNRSPLPYSRKAFVESTSGNLKQSDKDEIFQRTEKGMKELGVSLQSTEIKKLGHDGSALYYGIKSSAVSDGTVRNSVALGAMTLVNRIPVSVNVYDLSEDPVKRKAMMGNLQVVLKSMLRYE